MEQITEPYYITTTSFIFKLIITLATIRQIFNLFRKSNTKIKIPKVEDHILAIQALPQIATHSVGGMGRWQKKHSFAMHH